MNPEPNPDVRVVFDEIEAVSLTERVTQALKKAFFTGKLRPGDTIVERKIAREMNVGTPVVREALIALKHEGFVRRINNRGSFVTQFDVEEIRMLYALRVELETLALQWARTRVTAADLAKLTQLADRLVEAGDRGDRQDFLERDFEFHRCCWELSGNTFLSDTMVRLMSPLFAFVVLASESPLTASMAREHYALIDALRATPEPEFTALVRKVFTGFAFRWIATASQPGGHKRGREKSTKAAE
jgi:DNA-binding GntR family transcriptional regulator